MGADLYMETMALEPAFKALARVEKAVKKLRQDSDVAYAFAYNKAIDDALWIITEEHEDLASLGFGRTPKPKPR